jgi:hypothetical protein
VPKHPPEVHVIPGLRLGRRVNHDPRSRQFRYQASPVPLTSIEHPIGIPVLDQGDTGDCVANTGVEILSTEPFAAAVKGITLDEDYARALYHDLTVADDYPGTWNVDPPHGEDTGSDGLTLGKVLTSRGLISGYQHIFDVASFLAALQVQAVAVGLTWRSGCDNPSSTGLIRWTGTIRGGHELCAYAYDADRQWVRLRNHWTASWGDKGSCWMPLADLTAALAADGDATVLIPATKPAPTPTPSPADADATLVTAMTPWRKSVISRITKAGKAAAAFDSWRSVKGI